MPLTVDLMKENQNDTEKQTGSKTGAKSGSAVILIVLSFTIGVLLLLGLLVLRTNERKAGAQYPPDASTFNEAAQKLSVQKLATEEIETWIKASLAKSGSKVGVVNIWATWCEPCRTEMPEFVEFQKFGSAPVFLISADNESDEPLVRRFLAEKGAGFETALIKGDQQVFIERWQTLSSKDPSKQWSMSLPVTFVVNAAGQVLSFHAAPTTAKELTLMVKNALDTAQD